MRSRVSGRGFRAYVHPDPYPSEGTRIGYAAALALNVNRYFNNGQVYTENVKPTASLLTSGALASVNGLLEVRFTASDASGLSCATLQMEGNYIAETPLSGTSVDHTFRTPYFDAGISRTYAVNVYDAQGNRTNITGNITVASGPNRAPRASFSIQPHTTRPGVNVTLNAGLSTDPDNNPMTVEWDLDGDGTFETPASSTLSRTASFPNTGVRMIRCRLTDIFGAQSTSSPIPVSVKETTSDVANWELYN